MNSQTPFQANPESLSLESQRVLRALFEFARAVRNIDVGLLARELRLRSVQVGKALLELQARGFICVERLRLTMLGLVHATRLPELALLASASAPSSVVVSIEAARVVSSRRGQTKFARERPAAGGRAKDLPTGRLRRLSQAPGR